MPETLIKVDLTKSAYDNDMIHNRWHPDVPIVAWVNPGELRRGSLGESGRSTFSKCWRFFLKVRLPFVVGPHPTEDGQMFASAEACQSWLRWPSS